MFTDFWRRDCFLTFHNKLLSWKLLSNQPSNLFHSIHDSFIGFNACNIIRINRIFQWFSMTYSSQARSKIISHLVFTWRLSFNFSPGTQTSYLIAKYSKSYLIGYPAFLMVIVSIIPEYVSWRQTSSLNIQICVIIENLKLRFLMILNNFERDLEGP